MKKQAITVIATVLTYFLFSNVGHAQEKPKQYYTVLLKDPSKLDQGITEIKKKDGEITYTVPEIGLIQFKGDTQVSTNQSPLFESVNPSLQVETPEISHSIKIPNLSNFSTKTLDSNLPPLWDMQWDMKELTHNGESYKKETGSHNVVVGIIDSGVDVDHPDLVKNLIPGSKNFVPKGGLRGTEPEETGDINNINDINGHGTLVTGSIAANGEIKGVAPNTGIRAYRVFGNKSADAAWVINAIIEAAKDDVDVINLSLGSYYVNGKVYENGKLVDNGWAEVEGYKRAIEYANQRGSIVVASAGNDSINVANKQELNNFLKQKYEKEGKTYTGVGIEAPGELPGVVTVSSTGPTGQRSVFSNYGEGFIDISAPGGDYRLWQQYGEEVWWNTGLFRQEEVLTTFNTGRYLFAAGTSMAVPKVSATLALIINHYNYKNQPNRSISHLYKNGIKKDIAPDKASWGYGQLDVYNAIK
ncbi:S8 family serine peptidase [Bacillus cereus]|uniref:S8 family peptidase n=1 Tax=Bacillus cereus TaxID=1396 RepID=UPI000D0EB93A|nr:S8 family serine peptidase [Bacillus cereus]AVP47463.1 peptidase S8 [Bacillus cereus]MEC1966667.1 S8 family serine peptidase [Bacillus cereus]